MHQSPGSGVAIGSGRVATNCHITQGGRKIDVYAGEAQYPAMLVHVDEKNDFCVLGVPGFASKSISTVRSTPLKVGQPVYAIGNPKGLSRSMSERIVSAFRMRGGTRLVQTTAAISPGSSGGGLFDAQGKLVGITTFKLAGGESLNFAIPADLLAALDKPDPLVPAASPAKGSIDWRTQAAQERDASAKAELCRQWGRNKPKDLDALRCVLGADLIPDDEKLIAARTAYKLAPHNAVITVQYGMLLAFRVPNNDEIATLKKLLSGPAALSPVQQAQLLLRLGDVLSRASLADDAIQAYRRATVLNPKLAEAWERLAAKLMATPQEAGAARLALQEAIRLTPQEGRLWGRLADTYVLERQFEDAIGAQTRAIELIKATKNPIDDLFPENTRARLAEYRLDLARIYLQLNRNEEVLQTSSKALADLKDTPALDERVRASLYESASHWRLGDRAASVKRLAEGIKLCDNWDPTKAFIRSEELDGSRRALCGSVWYHRALFAQELNDPETVRTARVRLEILAPALAKEF